jgi:hypothetical protein
MANHLREILNLDSWFHHNIKNLASAHSHKPTIASNHDRPFNPQPAIAPFNPQPAIATSPNVAHRPANQKSPLPKKSIKQRCLFIPGQKVSH